MIIYFPISSLMTLFANILNNPLDSRAKSDTRLMNLVVTFLSMLGQEAETGGVHRMLGVCAEFERIAKSVIEKTEREQSSRRKRKNHDASKQSSSAAASANISSAQTARGRPLTPAATNATAPSQIPVPNANSSNLSPPQIQEQVLAYSPMGGSMNGASPSIASSNGWPQEFNVPQNGDFDSFNGNNSNEMFGFPNGDSPLMNPNGVPFQPPMLPQDLFSLPMNLDWDWAELSCGAYPTVENGNFDNSYAEPHA